MSKSLFALLIGIDEYHPKSKVRGLNGCVNDILDLENLLQKEYKNLNLHIKKLVNKKATRKNIISTFLEHLCNNAKIKKGDTILFHFSGHGSFSSTAKEFEWNDSLKQDETLVCYDSRLKGKHDLADKEIAILLSKIKEGIHTLLIFDSCHSKSITRTVSEEYSNGKNRFIPERKNSTPRKLSSYLIDEDNYYIQHFKEGENARVPDSSYISLVACQRDQEASETVDGNGVFTSTLLKVLSNYGCDLSYYELMTRVRAEISKNMIIQIPSPQPFNFNINQKFITGGICSNQKRHLVKFENGIWKLSYGALHGMPTKKENIKNIQLALFKNRSSKTPKYYVSLNDVKLNYSYVNFDFKDKESTFMAELTNMPNKLLVSLIGKKKEKEIVHEFLKKKPSASIEILEDNSLQIYKLDTKKNKYSIYHTPSKNKIFPLKSQGVNNLNPIISRLEIIEKWERIQDLSNPVSNISDKDVQVRFCQELKYFEKGKRNKIISKNKIITCDYSKKEGKWDSIWYHFEVKNKSKQPYFIALLYLDRRFGITVLSTCKKIIPNSGWITIDDNESYIDVPDQLNEVTDIFKIIIAPEEFNEFHFEQKNIDDLSTTRDIGKRKEVNPESNWSTRTFTINTIRREREIGKLKVQSNGITINKHSSFQASLNFAPINYHTRSARPINQVKEYFKGEGFDVIDLSTKKRGNHPRQDLSIIELSNITNDESLLKEPLVITVDKQFKEDEKIIPITFDGEFYIPFGKLKKLKNGKNQISINQLPTSLEDTSRQKIKTRNVPRAFGFCLLKLARLEKRVYKLRYVQSFFRGKLFYEEKNVAKKVKKAKRIVLVIHGIFGDTRTILEGLKYLYNDNKYDLFLSYDYENLNTKIEDIAEKLDEELVKVGLGKHHDKQLDIIAHSMGGLVSRYMIESIRGGDSSINKLILFGTPNGGSAFANLAKYRNGAVLLTIAANTATNLMYFLVSTFIISKTLEQMHPKHTFIKSLYRHPKPKTKYFIIAGNVLNYKSKKKWFKRMLEHIPRTAGKIAYRKKTPNDIAVSLKEIKHINTSYSAEIFDVDCHHLNYFEKEHSREILKQILKF